MEIEKLKKVLKQENADNYADVPLMKNGIINSAIISQMERLLARIEMSVFGKAKIQYKEFEKLCKKYPEYNVGKKNYKI